MNQINNLNQALETVFFFRGVIPNEALDYIASHRDQAIPLLLAELKNGITNCSKTGNYYVGHLFSLFLLAEFKEKQAYPLLIELLNLPIESIDRLLGDALTESLPSLMINLYDGDLDSLFSLLTNTTANRTLRDLIGYCLATLIYHKLVSAEEVTSRLQLLIASGKMTDDKAFFTALANLVLCAQLKPLNDVVIAAFNAGMIYQDAIDLAFFKKHLNDSPESLIPEKYRTQFSTASELAKWANYMNKRPTEPKIGRNDPCPCGRGPKYKECCLKRYHNVLI
jgi:hypothetical protein